MSTQILQTKLYVPGSRTTAGRGQHVQRQRLLEMLDAGLTRKLTRVCAPAGFGKSTLLSDWANQTAIARGVTWFSIDDGDNDPVRFWMHFVTALQTVDSHIGAATSDLLQSTQLPPAEALLTPLLNDFATDPHPDHPFVIILDDYHVIDNPAIHKGIFFLLDSLPPQLRIMLSSRADPPWPLARWRGQNQLIELRADDLRFKPNEATIFLQEVMQLDLSPADVMTLDTRTEGWIAGLQLVGLSRHGATDSARFITAFSGTNRYIVDYLVEEVLARQVEEMQRFLLQTSILERLCGALCDAVMEPDASMAHRGQAMLEQLDHANLFLIALDDERNWYRYHHLFGEVLQHRLRRSHAYIIPQLHRRASHWYQQQGLLADAIHHALAATDIEEAANLIEQMGIANFAQPNIQHALNRWLATLPDEVVHNRPRLSLIYGLILFVVVDIPAALQRVEDAEAALQRTLPHADNDLIRGEIAAMRALMYAYHPDYPPAEAVALGLHALARLHDSQPTWRCVAALALGCAYLKLGNVKAAEETLAEANRSGQAAGNAYLIGTAVSHHVAMQRAGGSLHRALATCQEVWAWAVKYVSLGFPSFAGLYMNFAELYREKNELDLALRYAEQAVARSTQVNDPSMFLISRLVILRVKYAQRDWEAMWTLLRQIAQQIAQQIELHPSVVPARIVPALTAQFQLAAAEGAQPRDDAALAAAWAWAQHAAWEEGMLLSASRFFDYVFMYEHRRIARPQVFLAWARTCGDLTLVHDTLAYLQQQLPVAETAGTLWYQVKIHLLQALAYDLLGDQAETKRTLTHALQLAQPQGYIRIFVDEGEPLRALMVQAQTWIAEAHIGAYVAQLLAAFQPLASSPLPLPSYLPSPTAPVHSPRPVEQLVESLTEREVEILHLVHEGLSNREIATRLIVTVGTVKRHLNNIFGKLGVGSRTQAIVSARTLGLLE